MKVAEDVADKALDALFEDDKPDPKDRLRAKNFILTPNDLDRCEVCPAAGVYVGPKPKPGPGQWYGIFVHRFLEYALTRGRNEALTYVRSKRNKNVISVCEKIDIGQIPSHAMSEMNIVIDLIDGTAEAAEREFAAPERHIIGRADLLYTEDGPVEWHVGDYKTGESHGISPQANTQLLTLATGVSLMQGAKDVKGSIIDVVKTGELRWHTETYTEKQIKAHLKRMRRIHLNVLETRAELAEEGVEPDTIPGPHCRGCRAEKKCHAGELIRD